MSMDVILFQDKHHIRSTLPGKSWCGELLTGEVKKIKPLDIFISDLCPDCLVGYMTRSTEK